MSAETIFLLVLGFCGVGIIGVLYSLKRREKAVQMTVKERIRPYVDKAYRQQLAEQKSSEQEEEAIGMLEGMADQISSLALSEDFQQNIRNWLLRAGMRVRPAEFLVLCLVIMVISGALMATIAWAALGSAVFLMGVIGFGIGWIFPIIYVIFRRSQRMSKFNDQLLDLITLMSNSLKSGYGFTQALNLVADESDPPASDEFNRVVRENNLGIPINEALNNLVDRMESEDLDLLVTAVQIQREIGGNLSEVLDNISDTIRERMRLQGQINALTAQGKMGGIIISSLPFALAGIFSLLRPDMMYKFVTDIRGIGLIALGIMSQGIGVFIIWQIVNIDT
ncbi:MAG: type II secretion system F family protein [bacterium]